MHGIALIAHDHGEDGFLAAQADGSSISWIENKENEQYAGSCRREPAQNPYNLRQALRFAR